MSTGSPVACDRLLFVGAFFGDGMDRDVELALSREVAALEATVSGFAKDVSRRLDEQAKTLDDIREDVRATNGRVTKLESANTKDGKPVIRSVTLDDLKVYVAIALVSTSLTATVGLWVLKVAGVFE